LVVLSDGLERGDPTAMADAVARFARLCWRIIWLTPLAADPAFEARTAGLVAARPFLDRLADGSSIEGICANVLDMANEKAA
ncbi:MAG: VWA domain-containing protein, partial [Xanthobacteraceae bacterium]